MTAPLRSALPAPTQRLQLGRDLRVSPLCLGYVADPSVVPAAFDAGFNFFFVTADMHWPLYAAVRSGLADLLSRGGGVRDDVVVAVVSYLTQSAFGYAPFLEVIESIPRLARIDVTVAGAAYPQDFYQRAKTYRAEHEKLGMRAFGASFHDRQLAARAFASRAVDVGFVRYNPFHRNAVTDLFPHLRSRAPSLAFNFNSCSSIPSDTDYARLGLGPDYWRPSATDYYRFALARPEIDGILCSVETLAHLRELLDALDGAPLTEEETVFLEDLGDLRNGKGRLVVA